MSCFRMMVENYVDLEILANSDVSSEQAAFPVTNAYNKNRRSKVWRSNGYWNIESGSNTIIFRETIATDLTATITPGEYTSTSSFMTALKAAFEATGASTYTITQDSNFKFVITSNGAGGGGILEIIWTDSDSTDMAAILGFDDSVDSTGAFTYTGDVLKINTGEWILWDMGISTNPKNFMMTGPRNRPIKLSPNSVIKLQGNETDVWTSPSYETTLTYDDEVMAVLSDDDAEGLGDQAYRYWRLSFEDQNPLGYVEIGVFFLGDQYIPERGRVQFPFGSKFIDRSDTVFSEGGQTFSDIKEQSQEYSIRWFGLTKADTEEITEIFREFGTSKPFFISMDSEAAFSTLSNRRMVFVKFADEPDYNLVSANLFECNMRFREEL